MAGERIEVHIKSSQGPPVCGGPPCSRPPARALLPGEPFRRSARTGFTVPSAFETCDTATMRVLRGLSSFSYSSRISSPRSSMEETAARALFSSHSICHGTMFEWCSSSEIIISSPALMLARPQELATRLMPSVVPRTKMSSASEDAFRSPHGFAARCLVGGCGTLAQLVNTAVNVGAVEFVETANRVDDGQRLLCRGRAVEVHKR